MKLNFHALLYIECHKRAAQFKKLVHPILKCGHSNAVEASHNVLIRFRSKDSNLERLHYQLSTNLGLLQSYLTCTCIQNMEPDITELFRRMKLPVFDGVVEALEKHSVLRKRALAKAKTTSEKRKE